MTDSASIYARASQAITSNTEAQNQAQKAAKGTATAAAAAKPTSHPNDPCTLFGITQYECVPREKVTCWPIERVFRQCGKGPAMEVTNRLVHAGHDGKDGQPVVVPLVDPAIIARPPRGEHWDFADGRD